MIEALALKGRLYTMDAMHGRRSRLRQRAKKTFKAAIKTNSHLLFQVKENQPCLLRDIEAIAAIQTPLSSFESAYDKKRSRDETRVVSVYDASGALENTDWNGLINCVIKVTRATLLRCAKDGSWIARSETSYYACSAPLDANKASAAIRAHWGIENRNHYVRDVAMLEDASRIRKIPASLPEPAASLSTSCATTARTTLQTQCGSTSSTSNAP